VIGLISGGLLSLFTVLPACMFYLRITRRVPDRYWILLAFPAAFAGMIAIWGFISTEKMTDQLGVWWQTLMDIYSR